MPLMLNPLFDSSVTLVGEADRKMLKAAIKHSSGEDQVRHRQVPPEVVSKWSQKLDNFKGEISEILQEEKEEKHVRPSGDSTDPRRASLYDFIPFTDTSGRDGAEEGREHDRARSGDLLAARPYVVPDGEGESQSRG